jgi:uncharacterized membrane protein
VIGPAGRGAGGLELAIGRVLRIGTVTSSACLAAGLLLTIVGMGAGLAGILLPGGLIILIATPAARVIVSVVEYVRERDWVFVALTLTVLAALVASVVAAFWGRGPA